MPLIQVTTNTTISAEQKTAVKSELGAAITAIPGKTESWLMVELEPEKCLYFKGSDAPAAMVEVSVFGKAGSADYNRLTAEVCAILERRLSIDPARIYVKYSEVEHWGWNGSNF